MTPDEHRIFVAQKIIRAREALGLSQAEMARRLKISSSHLANWEAGRHYPDVWKLAALCDDSGLTMDWFYRGVWGGVASHLTAALLHN